ncbi:MAG: hypothetical protein AAF662_01110 [Pseudomonadota bacterium]
MTEAYNDALAEQAEQNVWSTLADEASGMSTLEYTTLTADIVGIFDPTPISDGVGTVLSVAQGDFFGAGLSLLGMIPYVGDLGKIGKIARVAPRTARALETVLTRGDEMASAGASVLKQTFRLDEVAAARRAASERVKDAMLAARRGDPNCKDCAKLRGPGGERRRLIMPENGPNGSWRGGAPDANGNGTFAFSEPKTLPDGRQVDSIEFRDGSPVFDDFVEGGRHDLWEVSGSAQTDARRLRSQMRETNPGWSPPDADDFTLHHFEDGSVGYVPSVIHSSNKGGVAHTGGNSMMNNDLF